VNRNIKAGQTSCFIFEIGNVFHKNTEFIQEEVLNGAIYGNRVFGKWANSFKDNDLNYYQARGKLKESLSCLNIKIDDKPTDQIDFLHPGRTAKLIIEGKDAGYFGEIHPKLILEKKSLKKVYLFSINVDNLLTASTRKNKWIPIFKQYPIVPKIERDINFVFSKKFLISEIISQIRKTGKNLLEDVHLIDVFEDIKLGDDHVSYTFRLSYRDKHKTLLDSDIKSIHSNIITKVEKCFNTKMRN
jgi:phenylalanyl-tRNA synthetase beta chain